jgi:hypothetical protein
LSSDLFRPLIERDDGCNLVRREPQHGIAMQLAHAVARGAIFFARSSSAMMVATSSVENHSTASAVKAAFPGAEIVGVNGGVDQAR